MAEKIVIEIFRKKNPDELTAALSDPEGKLDIASGAALVAAEACSMALRAARLAQGDAERLDYLRRNLEHLRSYMVYLIDEDLKGRSIMSRAKKEGDEQKIDAAIHSVCAISDEIINQMCNVLDLLLELSEMDAASCAPYLGSAAHTAMAALQSARLFVVNATRGSKDETYAYITKRENEIRLGEYEPKVKTILERVEQAIF